MKTVLIWLTLCFGTLMTTYANGTAYLFSYFINDSKDGLHLAYSYDGLNWTALNGGKSYLTPWVKINRCVIRASARHPMAPFIWSGLLVGPTGLSAMPLPATWFIGASSEPFPS